MELSQLKHTLINILISILLLSTPLVHGDQTSSTCTLSEKPYDYVIITDDNNLHGEYAIAEDTLLADKLKEYGLNVDRKSFLDSEFDWSLTNSVILRSAWDRIQWKDQWSTFIQKIRSMTTLVNSFELHDELTDKRKYFQRLIRKGINVPKTEFIEMGSKGIKLEHIQKEHGWEDMVVKPNSGQVGYSVYKVTNDNIVEMETVFQGLVQAGHVLVQEFQQTFMIDESSDSYSREISAVYFDKKFSHAIGKTPKKGGFKVQGGWNWNHTATEEEIEFGKKVISAFEDDYPVMSYMRIDMFRDNSDDLAVMEVSGRGADLFFRTNSSAIDAFAKHLYELSQNFRNACNTDQLAEAKQIV